MCVFNDLAPISGIRLCNQWVSERLRAAPATLWSKQRLGGCAGSIFRFCVNSVLIFTYLGRVNHVW